jgi:hypothetical protein
MAAQLVVPVARAAGDIQEGWHVPWAVGGPRLADDGSVYQHPGEWPEFPIDSLRLWDTRTAWLNLQPRSDRFDFSHLDAHLERANAAGVRHITLVLAGTPRWAAAQELPTDAPWLGPGSASPPADLGDWAHYVEQVTTRYRGRIQAYQIGNEPNLPMFWTGSAAQLGDFIATAAQTIRRVDPGATIIAPAPLIRSEVDVRYAHALWSAISSAPIDVLAFHFYPRSREAVASLPRIVGTLRRIARSHGFVRTPLWITEANPGPLGGPALMSDLLDRATTAGVDRVYWYAWMRGDRVDLMDMSGIERCPPFSRHVLNCP